MKKHIKPPFIARILTRKSIFWEMPPTEKVIYLTFDDGPIPELTPKIVELLNSYQIKATFFCVGENIRKNPKEFELIIQNKHDVGNHTYNHLNGWKTDNKTYYKNFLKSEATYKSTLFRPPYGKIRPYLLAKIAKTHAVILWSVLTYDFSPKVNGEECLQIAIKNLHNGAIVVFHDNIKAADTMLYALPRFIEYAISQGFSFRLLSSDTQKNLPSLHYKISSKLKRHTK
jgi:peptidoglycan/xylan/chitin deacetylase (PgdA/CDA1 family)